MSRPDATACACSTCRSRSPVRTRPRCSPTRAPTVIKVERPGIGDIARWVGVSVNGMSSLYLVCNRGKRSIALDLAHARRPRRRPAPRRRLRRAHPELPARRDGQARRSATTTIRAVNPDVVYVSLSGFGSGRPVPRPQRVRHGDPGLRRLRDRTRPTRPTAIPVFLRQTAADKVTALYAAQAITAALFARERGRGGQHLELSMMDAVVSFLWADAAANEVLLDSDGSQPRASSRGSGRCASPTAGASSRRRPTTTSPGCARALGVDGLRRPARRDDRRAHASTEGSTAILVEQCYAQCGRDDDGRRDRRASRRERVPFAMIVAPAELPNDPHAVAVGLFETYEHHVVGRVRLPAAPDAVRRDARRARPRESPALGEHTDEILAELGLGDRAADLRAAGVVA